MKNSFIILIIIISFLSCEEIINEQNISEEIIELLAPSENAVLSQGVHISFNWEAINGALDYKLQIANPSFNAANQILLDTLIKRTDFKVDSLFASNYEWRVKGVNSAYETIYSTNGFAVVD